ncbi:MAG: LPS assembly protein LptD [Gammaproteobacteria bacterium]|nr:LPS assembly protein LptD [Gammaproteobacteria bacterium]
MKKLTTIISPFLFASTVLCSVDAFASASVANALGWMTGHVPGEKHSKCNGFYAEPKSIEDVPHPPSYKKVPIVVTATGPVIFRTDGVSILQENVIIRQPGRLIHADKAFIYHNQKTGKITDIKLVGHVRVQEAGKLMLGDTADYDLAKNSIFMNKAIYHIIGEHELPTLTTSFDAWGVAKSIHRKPDGVIDLKEATYSTCSPKNPSWYVKAGSMQLNHAAGEGSARNVVIHFKHVPIFYTPYFTFPLNSARKSGFMAPKLGYENGTGQHGFYLGEPYYWNMAPNYDLLFTPTWYSQRGVQADGLFRYLTAQSDGFFYGSILPNDREFSSFQKSTLNTVSNNSSTAPYISELNSASNNRMFLNFENNVAFNHYWTGKFYARYISDSYYAQDFQTDFLSQTSNQIPSFAELDYTGQHWQDTFLIQTYQTLHPLGQINTPAQNQYTRLPELDISAAYPQFVSHYNFNLSAQAVNFMYQSDFTPQTYQLPIGERVHLQPNISRPFTWPSFYVTPTLIADSTSYFAQLASTGVSTPRQGYDVNRTLPIFDVDSGLYFDREATIGGKHYTQTLEPRIFYLYTPYLNQNNYPNFDTQLLPFSPNDLYSINQFSGFDRLQNANQVSLGVTSNLLRQNDASDILSAQLGLIDYFTDPRVCLSQSGCQTPSESISPITGNLIWNPNELWSINSQIAWDTTIDQVNNAQAGVEYHFLQRKIILLNYQFTNNNSDTPFDAPVFNTNASLISAGLIWPITVRWQFFGYEYYDLTNSRPRDQYVGLAYDTCCWAFRFIMSKDYNGVPTVNGSASFENQYTTNYYLEFLLKGLGSVGNNRAENMLSTTLPGFSDVFSNRGHYGFGNTV